MQPLIKNSYKSSLLLALLVTIVIAYLSLTKLEKPIVNFSHLDKLQHFIAYFALTLSWLIVTLKYNISTKKYIVLIGCVSYGIIIEILQEILTNYREASILDAIANSLGTLIAMYIFNIFFEKNKLFNI